MKYVTVAEMVAVEKEANEVGLTYEIMMENAGKALADVILNRFTVHKQTGVLGLVGSGNNGGDTLVALSYLAQNGWKTSAYQIRPRPENDTLTRRYIQIGGNFYDEAKDSKLQKLEYLLDNHSLLLDGILGTGIKLPLKPDLAKKLDQIKAYLITSKNPLQVIAVDCPSGVDCDTGEAAPQCIPANLTITMAAIKQGLLKFPAYNFVGEIQKVGIGLPDNGEALTSWKAIKNYIPDRYWIKSVLPKRPLDAHKGTFGTALVIAGSANYTGAALLAGKAAYRIGAGLVTLAIPSLLHSPMAGIFPEATWLLLPHESGMISSQAAPVVLNNLDRVSSILVGPGFGLGIVTSDFLNQLISTLQNSRSDMEGINKQTLQPSLVIDADGLKLLVKIPNWWQVLPENTILTPHPGEMSVLTGLQINQIQNDRLEVARRFSQMWGHIVILKGAFTVVSAPDGTSAVIPVASPSLARAGSGDVLAGLIVGLLAQGSEPFNSAVMAAYIHAQAGLKASETIGNELSILAGEILNSVPEVITELLR